MTILIERLGKEADEFLRQMCKGIYLDGECYAFAIALHRRIGWPIVGLLDDETVRHAVVSCDSLHIDDEYFDARGGVVEVDLGRPFEMRPPYNLQYVTEEDLFAIRPIQDASIHRAARMAELLWPDLPWKNSWVSKIRAFAEDLESVSRKHGLWIRTAVPGSPPMLAEAGGDESGYLFRPTDDSMTYSVNRYFDGLVRIGIQ